MPAKIDVLPWSLRRFEATSATTDSTAAEDAVATLPVSCAGISTQSLGGQDDFHKMTGTVLTERASHAIQNTSAVQSVWRRIGSAWLRWGRDLTAVAFILAAIWLLASWICGLNGLGDVTARFPDC
jgi:hypothetical protein